MKIADCVMWSSFLVTGVISIFTIIVSFGIVYISSFANFMLLEVSLAISFLIWGICGLINPDVNFTKQNFYLSCGISAVFLLFLMFGIY